MKSAFILFQVLVILSLFSCSPSRDEMSGKIANMESKMEAIARTDTAGAFELLSAYQNFVTKYPDDSMAPEYLFRAAGLAGNYNRGTQAIELYESVIHSYPDYKRVPECYFMEAFIYENVLGNIGKADEYYEKFLDKYPEHHLADDARTAIKLLGKTPDEIVREFERMNADSGKTVNR